MKRGVQFQYVPMQFQYVLPAIAGWLPSLYIKINLLKIVIECVVGKTTNVKVKIDKSIPNYKINCKMKWLIGLPTFTVNDGVGR